jgi:ABC-type glycerol-3-phosphate transport system substrate-binding protein
MFREISKMINQNKVQAASNSSNFTTQQTAFLDGQAMMMVNGNWLGCEMKKNDGIFDGEKFRMMNTPVISTIIDRLTTIEDDEALSLTIKCVDEEMTYDQAKDVVNGLSEADYKEVWDARNMRLVGGSGSGTYLANYSLALENAKIFYKFIYSDEAGAIFRDLKHINPIFAFADESYETNYDYSTWDAWSTSVKDAWTPEQLSYSASIGCSASRLYESTDTHGNVDIIKAYTSTNAADRQTYEQRWTYFTNYINTNWVNWMSA